MTKKMISWLACMAVFLIFYSCRTEDFSQDEKQGTQKYKVFILNKKQIAGEKSLLKQLSEIKTKFHYRANAGGKNIQNHLLDGAIIGTDRVLLVEKNGMKTYTFPVSRTYISDQSENLVVKEIQITLSQEC